MFSCVSHSTEHHNVIESMTIVHMAFQVGKKVNLYVHSIHFTTH